MILEMNKVYIINLAEINSEIGSWFKVSMQLFPDLLTDGRILGRVLENVMSSLFSNVSLSESVDCDLKVNNTFKVEIKSSLKNGGINFAPSNMIGASRKYNFEEHTEKTKELDYYIAIDRSKLPIIELIPIESKIENVSLTNRLGNKKANYTAIEWNKYKEKLLLDREVVVYE